jgi:DNA polymerase-3 subunit delta'
MGFAEFHGNAETVTRIREMLARDRFPHALILSGPRGAGKFTLAQMIAKAMNCLENAPAPPLLGGAPSGGLPDFCGRCSNCTRIAEADPLEQRCAEAIEARENLRETDKRETRIFVQTHPDVLIIPPDPPQMMIKVDQVRHVIGGIYYRPTDARQKVYIFTDSAFMKEAANSLLKILEEPPEYATLILLTENPGELLATIRSRSIVLQIAPLPAAEIERDLAARRPDLAPPTRALVARLAAGAVGRARSFDLAAYTAARQDALTVLNATLNSDDHSALFRTTETYRAGAEGKEKTEALISAVYGLLEDVLFVLSGAPQQVRNVDIRPQLEAMAKHVDFEWISRAAQRLGEVESGMRRNLLRSLSLDAFAVALER